MNRNEKRKTVAKFVESNNVFNFRVLSEIIANEIKKGAVKL